MSTAYLQTKNKGINNTDNAIAPEMIPDGIYTLSEEGKVRALEFTVSRETENDISVANAPL